MHTIQPADVSAKRFHALADPTRLAILDLLRDGERRVCDLTEALDAAQSRLSFHLKVLKDAELVLDRRDGRWVHYRLHIDALDAVREALAQLLAPSPRAGIPWFTCCGPSPHDGDTP
jgi:ArsR family transcriptional regulator, arsenate/arsenite/antimonite-responsive transcriptional repressor